MVSVRCASRGGEDDLRGISTDDGIEVRGERCGALWMRDTTHRSRRCGGAGIALRPRTLTAFSRGTLRCEYTHPRPLWEFLPDLSVDR